MGLKEREFCSYPRCNCPIDKTTICARGLPEPEEEQMSVWTDWLDNPGTGECPVPGWAESHQVVLADEMESPVNDLNPKNWKWSDDCGGEITHYRYAVPLSLASLARNYSRWGEIVGPVTNTHRMGWVYRDWLRARCDLGYDSGVAADFILPENSAETTRLHIDVRATPEEEEEWARQDAQQAPSKYHRNIKGVYVDVYDIIHAYGITNPGDQHAIKKMLQAGNRGYKSARQDREEAIVSLRRANELEGEG